MFQSSNCIDSGRNHKSNFVRGDFFILDTSLFKDMFYAKTFYFGKSLKSVFDKRTGWSNQRDKVGNGADGGQCQIIVFKIIS